jgi:hypothetical protein
MTNKTQIIEETTGDFLKEVKERMGQLEEKIKTYITGEIKLRAEIRSLRKQTEDLAEQYLARDVGILNRLGLKWPPDTTFAEVLATAWQLREQKQGTLIYLASPYSHVEPHIRQYRYETAMEATAWLLADGHCIYSPIVHNHVTADRCGIPIEWDQWERFDELMISRSDELWVLAIDGWLESVGVQAEIKIAAHQGKPVRLVQQTPGGWEVGPEVWDAGMKTYKEVK